MKIYVSDSEEFFKIAKDYSEIEMLNICLLSNNNHTITLQEGTKIQSLEQHEEEIRKQERLKVIAELEEWANTCYLVESIYEGVYCIDKDDLKEKLKEMKEV